MDSMNFTRISVTEAQELLKTQPATQVIDIRDEQAFGQGHISDARHVHNDNVQDFMAVANLDQPLIVCCYHGNMSQSAAAYFAEQGFESSYSLDGGFEAWQEAQA
ncbi:MAG: thiosulfate sulfurtransferase [Pseudohongiellaceae bacterium]|jgi:thiosulfate sulfurtransferase